MNKCECPIDGGSKQRNSVVSNEQSNTIVRPGQDLQSDAGEKQHRGHASGSSGSTGPMELAIGVDAEGGD
eukprot:2365332-Heterocapsa_arctica.AAC.1